MVDIMLKKNWFLIALLILYILFLSKDFIFGYVDNTDKLINVVTDEKLNYYQEEYKKMQKLLNINYYDYNVIYSKVVLRDIYAFYKEIVIGKGSNDGIKKQDIVINDLGVIGVVNEVNKNSSVVMLLTNSDTQLSVKINDSYGMLTSVDNKIVVKNIKLDKEIKEGDLVYTSGLTNIPGNVLVGKVISVAKDNLELEYIINVESASNLQNINYVAVINGLKEVES